MTTVRHQGDQVLFSRYRPSVTWLDGRDTTYSMTSAAELSVSQSWVAAPRIREASVDLNKHGLTGPIWPVDVPLSSGWSGDRGRAKYHWLDKRLPCQSWPHGPAGRRQ